MKNWTRLQLSGRGPWGDQEKDLQERPEMMVVSWNLCGICKSAVDDILDGMFEKGIKPDIIFRKSLQSDVCRTL